MPIPYRDQEDIEELGSAAFLRIEPQTTPDGFRAALFQINARGEPIEFTYNRVQTPSTFLWRPADIQRAAARRLAVSLFALSPRVPCLICCLADEVPGDLFSREITVSIPVVRIATGLRQSGTSGMGAEEILDQPDPLQLFWYPAPPEAGTAERRLIERLTLYGLLLEPFERASAGLSELYGVPDPSAA